MSENYLQHADHFARVLSIQETNKAQISNNNVIEQDFKKDNDDSKSQNNKHSSLNSLDKID